MSNQFTELIIKAPFLFVKGFLLGFMHSRNLNFDYFFHRKSGIKRETLGEHVKELLAIDCYTDLCLPNDIVNDFEKSLKQIDPGIGVTIEDKRQIKDASFTFSFKLYNRESTKICKQIFEYLPPGVTIKNFEPKEIVDEKVIGIHEYAPVHPYIYQGEGEVNGDFNGVMNLFLTIKRSELSNTILCSEINLNFI
jgi:hypothetical protein